MRKVLILTYHYPPCGAVGEVRPAKFVRYLPELGWEPAVLTVRTSGWRLPFSKEGTAEIYRVREWPHPEKIHLNFKLQRATRMGLEEKFTAKMSVPYAVAMEPHMTGIAELKRWVLAFLALPDRELGWFFPAISRAVRVIRDKRITHLITTGPPFTCHLVGLALKRRIGVQWIADFQDPWSLSYKPPILRNEVTDFVETRMIRSVIEKADLTLFTTPQMTEQAKKEYSALDPGRFQTLTNGFDPSDFVALAPVRATSGFVTFSYLGTFYYGRTPEPFLRALKSLTDDGTLKPSGVRVKFVGNVAVAEGRSVREMIHELGLEKIVTVESPIPRHEALRRTMEADVALVLDEHHPAQIPHKLYEALAAGTTILNIGSKGAVSEVLARTGKGIAVDHRNLDEIRKGILECIQRSGCVESQGHIEPWHDPAIQEFNFRHITGRLAGLLESLRSPV